MKESCDGHERELERVRSDLGRTELDLAEHEEKAPLAAQRFRFYQELRGYVTDLVECLDEKVGLSFVHRGQQAQTTSANFQFHIIPFTILSLYR